MDRHFAVSSGEWTPAPAAREIYAIASTAAPKIGNGSADRNIAYNSQGDGRSPRKSLSLRDWYVSASRGFCRETISPLEMYVLLEFPSAEYDAVGEMGVGKVPCANQCIFWRR